MRECNAEKLKMYLEYIIENKCSQSECARYFKVNPSNVNYAVRRMKKIDEEMALKAEKISKQKARESIILGALNGARISQEKAKVTKKDTEKKNSTGRVYGMPSNAKLRKEVCDFIIKNNATFVAAAEKFLCSESTIRNVVEAVKNIDGDTYLKVKKAQMDGCMKERSSSSQKIKLMRTYGDSYESGKETVSKVVNNRMSYRETLVKGDVVDYRCAGCRKVLEVQEVYKNFFKSTDGECYYYQHIIGRAKDGN